MLKGSGPPPHRHERFDEGFHLLEGEIEYTLGDDRRTVLAKTGDSVWIPRNTTHAFTVASDTAKALNFYTPGGWEDHRLTLSCLDVVPGKHLADAGRLDDSRWVYSTSSRTSTSPSSSE